MSNVVVTLGGVAFQDFEVPEKISFGGSQRLAVQELLGGGRVVDVLGGNDGEIRFGGVFSGGDAAQRSQTLDALRTAGSVVVLLWDAFYYNVVIVEYAADYCKSWWIPFSLRCVVAGDPVADDADVPAALLVANDLGVAAGLFGLAGVSFDVTGATAAGLAAAQLTIGAGISTAGAGLDDGVVALSEAPDAFGGIAAMNRISADSGSLAGLVSMSGYVGRAASNLVSEVL